MSTAYNIESSCFFNGICLPTKGLCKEFFYPKIRVYYGSGWVSPGLSRNFFCGKSSQNSSKPLIFWISIPCVFCLYNTSLKVVSCYDLSVWMGVGGVSSIQVYLGFFLTLQRP